ncbi:hypothetical protein D3C85_1122660 [compost metagenome]
MEHGEAGQRGEGADDDAAAFFAHGLDHGGRVQLQRLERSLEGGRHHDAQAGEQGHHVDGEGHEEGIAPAPVEEVGGRQLAEEVGEQGAGHDQAEGRAQLRHHGVPAATVLRRADGQKRSHAVPGAAQSHALTYAQDDQHDRRPVTDLGVAGQEAEADRRQAHQEQGDGQLGPAPEAPVDLDEQGRTDGAGDEGHGEDGEGEQGAAQRSRIGKDQLREDHDRSDRIDEEVEEFRRATDDHADRNFSGVDFAVSRVDLAGVPLEGL